MSKAKKAKFRVVHPICKAGATREAGFEFIACVHGSHVSRWLQQGRIIRVKESEVAK